MKNRYALFIGSDLYPAGGWNDLFSVYETIKDAQQEIQFRVRKPDWWHIVDLNTGDFVE